ncbi:MAG: hypothetical protein ABMA00_21330, partial [Gemmatimonas sp.]
MGNGLPEISSLGTAFTLSGVIGGSGNISFSNVTITGATLSGIQAAGSLVMGALSLTDVSINNSGNFGVDVSAPANGAVTLLSIIETASGASSFSGNLFNAIFVDNAVLAATISGSGPGDPISFTNNGDGLASAGAGDIS